jgi:hypothetical protein
MLVLNFAKIVPYVLYRYCICKSIASFLSSLVFFFLTSCAYFLKAQLRTDSVVLMAIAYGPAKYWVASDVARAATLAGVSTGGGGGFLTGLLARKRYATAPMTATEMSFAQPGIGFRDDFVSSRRWVGRCLAATNNPWKPYLVFRMIEKNERNKIRLKIRFAHSARIL